MDESPAQAGLSVCWSRVAPFASASARRAPRSRPIIAVNTIPFARDMRIDAVYEEPVRVTLPPDHRLAQMSEIAKLVNAVPDPLRGL
jgi:hypothetical protein